MSALTSLLVRDDVVSVRQIEAALERQVLEDGELDTALLELDAARENTLNAYRAAGFGEKAASRADLMDAAAEALSCVPSELAQKHRIVAFARREGALHVAVAEPLAERERRAVEEALGMPLQWYVATELRIEAALAQHYGIEIAPRLRRLAEHVARLDAGVLEDVRPMPRTEPPPPFASDLFDDADEGDADDDAGEVARPEPLLRGMPNVRAPAGVQVHGSVEEALQAVSAVPLPPPAVVTEHGVGAAAFAREKPVEVARVVSITAQPPAETPKPLLRGNGQASEITERFAAPSLPKPAAPPDAQSSPPRGALAPRQPLSVASARELLDRAATRDEVIEVFFSYARQHFESSALFAVREDRAIGLESWNTPAVSDARELSILFEPRGVLEQLSRSPTVRVVDLTRQDADRSLALALGRGHMQPCALVPVCIKQRMVALVYGDRAGERLREDELAELVSVLPNVSQAFERIIRERKLFAMQARQVVARRKSTSGQPSVAAPRAVWSSAPPAADPRPSRPPQAAARSTAPRPHEVPTPHARPRRMPEHTLTGLAADPSKRKTTARDMPSAPPAAPPTSTSSSRLDLPPVRPSSEARAALSSLGVPRSAPPPPRVDPREALEQQPTTRLLAQRGHAETPLSKPPPGAGEYRSYDGADDETAAANVPDPGEPPETPRTHLRRPPARVSQLPPGAGSYKMQGGEREVVSLPPGRLPGTSSGSSVPSQPHGASDRPPEMIAVPPAPRVPTVSAEPAEMGIPERRASQSAITQPLGPSRARSKTPPPDVRREDAEPAAATTDVVHMSKAVRDSLRPPAPSAAARPVASTTVDASAQLRQLVSDLCRTGPDDEGRAVQALLRSGEAVLPLLAERFPGPLWFDRRGAHPRLPLGRDVSAVARALSAFGEAAVPQLAELLRSPSADTRFYATLLAGDEVLPGLLSALAERLFDRDPQIRLIVKDVLPLYRDVPGFPDAMRRLRDRAQDAMASIQDRLAAIDALSVLRDAASVPLFITLNESPDRQLSLPAHRALVAITAQDFGSSTRKWRSWYEEHASRHRIEWLIEGLMHSEQSVRATAGIELQKATQVYYGYAATAPKRDRERTQRRYQDWWQIAGKPRFTR